MSFIWPPNPNPGDRVTGPYGEVYQWDAIAWSLVPGGAGGGAGGDFPEAPSDGRLYGRNGQLTQWQPTLPLAGGATTGIVQVNPTAASSQPAQLAVGGQGISYMGYGAIGANIAFAYTSSQLYAFVSGTAVGPFATQQWVSQNSLMLNGGTMNGDIRMGNGSLFLGTAATQPLEAVTLQQLQGGWLPLSGGTLTGSLDINFTPGPGGHFLNISGNVGYTLDTPASTFAVNNIVINNDNTDTTTSGPGGQDYLYVGGTPVTGFTGNRNVIHGFLNIGGLSGNVAPGAAFYVAVAGQASASAPDNPESNNGILGGYFDCTINSASTNWNAMGGIEVDIDCHAGSSVKYRTGINLVIASSSQVQGTVQDTGYSVIAGYNSTSPFKVAFVVGGPTGIWPVDPNGTIIGTLPTQLTGPPYTAAYGIDFRAVTFGTAAFASNGFSVAQSGAVTASTLTSAGDVNVANGSHLWLVPGIAGLSWTGAEILANQQFGAASLVITGQSQLGSAGGVDTIIGGAGAVSPSATHGFLVIPYCGSPPSGVPANNTVGIAMVYDVSTHKLWAYEGGAWKGVTFE